MRRRWTHFPQLPTMYTHPHTATNSCYNCGKPGHISRDCTEAKQETNRPPRQNNNYNQRSDTKCFNCGGYGHMARDCGKGNTIYHIEKGGPKCYNCGKEGHFSRECNNQREQRAPREAREPRQGAGECYHCHEVGHFARECPSKQQVMQIKLDWYSLHS